MSRFLFAAHPTVGHTQALRAVGRALLARGHEVRFALPDLKRPPSFLALPAALRSSFELPESIERDGFTRVALPTRLRTAYYAFRVARARGYEELGWALRLFMDDVVRITQALERELAARPAEVVVADCFHYGSALAAERAGIPFVPVFHSGLPFPVPGGVPFGMPLAPSGQVQGEREERSQREEAQRSLEILTRRVDGEIARARRALGLPPAPPGMTLRPHGKALNVLTTFEAFEEPRPDLVASAAGPLLFAGPCLGTRPEVPFPWDRIETGGPNVYISLGTVFNDQPAIYRTLIEGVHGLGGEARAIVSAGASLEALRPLMRPRDVLVKFAPQLELLAKVDVAIVHGGNNSTNEALRAGTPMLLVPFGGEQAANARRAQKIAGAQAIAPESLTNERVTMALRLLLSAEARERSRALAAAVPQEDGVPRVVAALEALIDRRSPERPTR